MGEQRACGHVVPPTAVRCPICGTVAGQSSRPAVRRKTPRPIGLIVVGILSVAGVVAFVLFRPTGGGTPAKGTERASGPTPTTEAIPFPEPTNLNSVKANVDPMPPFDVTRYRITDPKSKISFASLERISAAGDPMCRGSSPSTCTYMRQEWKFETDDYPVYGEEVHLIPIHPGDTDESVLGTDYTLDDGSRDGYRSIRKVTVDGHPGLRGILVFDGFEQTQVVRSTAVVRTKAGYLRILVWMVRKHGAGAPSLDPLLSTFKIP